MVRIYRRISGLALDCIIVAAIVLAAVGWAVLSIGKLAANSAILLAANVAARKARIYAGTRDLEVNHQ